MANCGLRRDIARQASQQHARGGVCRKAAVSNRAHARLHRRTEVSLLFHRHNDAMAHLGGVMLPCSYAIYSFVHLPHSVSFSCRGKHLHEQAISAIQRTGRITNLSANIHHSSSAASRTQHALYASHSPAATSFEPRDHGRQAGVLLSRLHGMHREVLEDGEARLTVCK